LLQQHRADQPGNAGFGWEDADDIGSPFDQGSRMSVVSAAD
jgi:hypothetical protein